MRTLWRHCQIATMVDGHYNLIKNGALITEDAQLLWVGDEALRPAMAIDRERLLNGRLVTPGLIDCHSHSVFGGDRSQEFAQRLNGASYAEIAASGGGIASTVKATRAADEAQLFASARRRIEALRQDGVTSLEIKSGYGLSFNDERKMLRVIRQLNAALPLTVYSTCLAAHALPVEYQGRSDAYIDEVCDNWLPRLHAEGLVDAVDAFCEHLAFSVDQVERVFRTAQRLGLAVKLHAEQLSLLHGAGLAARYNALSADHLEYLCESDIKLMAQHGTCAVLLPGAFYFLRESQLPPVALLRQYRVPMAISSDLNPGTSPVLSLRLMMNMACTLFRLTPEEALAAVTVNAAGALGISQQCGTLQAGKRADFVAWDVNHPAELSYWLGGTLSKQVIYQGEEVWND